MTPEALARLHTSAIELPPPWSAADFAALLADPHVFLVGDTAAFALGRTVADEAELLTIVTAPAQRRAGLGRARLAAYEAAAESRGARRSFLEVAQTNVAARALYAAAGYRPVGRRRGYYLAPDGGRIDALILEKKLAEG